MGRLDADQSSDKVQSSIHAGSDAAAGDDSQTSQSHIGTFNQALWSLAEFVALAAFASVALATEIVWAFVQDEGILLPLFAKIETGVVDHVALLHNIGAFKIAIPGSFLAQHLQLDVVVWMRGGRQTLQNTCLGKEQCTSADGEECTFLARVLLLKIDEFFAEVLGLVIGFENGFGATAWDDDDVPFLNVFDRVFKVDVSLEGNALGGFDCRSRGSNGDVEGFGGCSMLLDLLEECIDKQTKSRWYPLLSFWLWRAWLNISMGPTKSRESKSWWRGKRTWRGSLASLASSIALILPVLDS
jgi:hypothetical protein